MVSILLSLACADQRFSTPMSAIERCELWAAYLPAGQPGDRIVTCTERSLALQSTADVEVVHARWTTSLEAQGLVVRHATTRPGLTATDSPMVSEVWADDAPVLALAISRDTVTHVSLAVLP